MTEQASQPTFEEVHLQIHEAIHADHEVRWLQTVGGFSSRRMPEQGMFVKTGPHGNNIRGSIGWVVQVRLKQGQFGSDNYILCHHDNGGWAMQHANQVFYPLTPAEVDLVRPFFADCLPENHDFSRGMSINGKEETRMFGFLIDPPVGFEERGGEGASMRMTTTDASGKTTVTETVFL